MILTLNGENRELPDGLHADGLIELLGLAGKRVAVEINGDIVPRSRYSDRQLATGDVIEIVHAVGGG